MNKRLLAVAVAGALAAPLAAYAQSSVTISGTFKGSMEGYKYSNSAKANNSSTALTDDSSNIVFRVVEQLSGGLSAVFQLDIRYKPDDNGGNPAALSGANTVSTAVGAGNTWYGLQSKTLGRIVFGRQDIHYFNTESDMATLGSLRSNPVSLLAFAAGGTVAIAGATRTQNIVHYLSPNWGGFTMIAAYSSNPVGQDSDIGSGIRKGSAWNLNPNYQAAWGQIGYSYWSSKPDGVAGPATVTAAGCGVGVLTVSPAGVITNTCTAATTVTGVAAATPAVLNQRADRLYGSFKWGGFKFGLAFDKSRLKSSATGASASSRTAWSFPASYNWGNHGVHAHYTKARDDTAIAGDQSAKMIGLGYAYKLSARTSAALTYVKITNAPGAAYQPFTANSLGSVTNSTGTAASGAIAAGEDPSLWSVTLRHTF